MTVRFRCRYGHEAVVNLAADKAHESVVCPTCGCVKVFDKGEAKAALGSRNPTLDYLGAGESSSASGSSDMHERPTDVYDKTIEADSHIRIKAGNSPSDPLPTSDYEYSRDQFGQPKLADSARLTPQLQSDKPPDRDVAPPDLAGYNMIGELGRGGMGIVYRAYDERNGRDVALKTMQRISPGDLQRFKREFRALADIAHPNLVSLYELLSDGENWCFAMELLDGVTFLEYVWSGCEQSEQAPGRTTVAEPVGSGSRLSLRRLIRLQDALKQLAVGLHALHESGKLHRDIKPSNVMVTRQERLVMLDFGLVADAQDHERKNARRVIQGTPDYMSPEQAAAAAATEASDWYAVGVMLYEVLTGRLPFAGQAIDVIVKKQKETPVAPIEVEPSVPKELNDLCMALLDLDPQKRPGAIDVLKCVDAADVAEQLRGSSHSMAKQSIELVGREPHLDMLKKSFADVANGETRSVFVHGRSGMGKTVLIRVFLDDIKRDQRSVVLEGRCYEQESVPFKALDNLVDSLSDYLDECSEEVVRELMPADSLPLTRLFPVLGRFTNESPAGRMSIENAEQQELRQRALDALRDLFTKLGKRRPLVLYVDDLQWGDEDSASLLADLVRPPDAPCLLLLGSYRSEDVGSSPCLRALADAYEKGNERPHRHELAVESLSHQDSMKLARILLNNDDMTAGGIVDRIARESGGWPFFVWELAQHVQDGSGVAGGSLDLDEVIWSRVCRLPQATRRLLELFAVSGRPMRATEAFQAIDEVADGPRLLAQLRTNNFVRISEAHEETVVESYHDRIRESVVNHLPGDSVRRHYLSLAFVIEQTSRISLADLQAHIRRTPDFQESVEPYRLEKQQWQRVFDLSYFYDAAGKQEQAFPYALVAGERGLSQNALEVAEQQYLIAARGAEMADEAIKFRVAEGLGDVLMMRGRYERATKQFQTARSLVKDVVPLARIDGKLGALAFKQGNIGNATKHLETALTELGKPPPKNIVTRTAALMKEAVVQMLHTYLPSRFVGRRSVGTDKHRMDSQLISLYDGLGYPYWFSQGPIPTLWTHLRHMNLAERYPPSQELGRAYAMHAVMITAVPLAGRGAAYAEKSYEIHGQLGDRLGQGKARSFQTFSLLALGRFKEGVETGREAVRLLEQAGDVWEANMARLIVSQPLYFLGDLRNSYLEVKRAYEIGKETGDFSAMALALYFWSATSPQSLPEGALQFERERPREDPLSSAGAIQGRGIELLLREDKPAEAAAMIQESLDVARQRGLRNPCVFCGATWKATALRIVAEREPAGPSRRRALAVATKAVRTALKITKSYKSIRAQALRERAIIAVLESNEKHARYYFDESLRVADEQQARHQRAQTLLARGEAGVKFGWPEATAQMTAGRAEVEAIEHFEPNKR